MHPSHISIIDYTTLVIYLLGIFIIALISQRKVAENSTQAISEQYLAGKSLTFKESLFSIIATEVSALTFLGIPAFAYGKDFSFVQIYFGAIFGRYVIAKVFLPKIYDQGLTVYAVMAKNNSTKNGQRFTATFYFINKILAVGVRLFSGSILVAQFFGLNIYNAIFIICLLTFIYTLIGGLKAVVRTDMAQMGLFILGGIIAHFIIPSIDGRSWYEMMTIALDGNKLNFIDFSNMTPFFTGVIGGILFDMATHGVDQDFAQRLTANKSLKSAQRAIVCSSFLSISVALIFLGIGALLWSHYQVQVPPQVSNDQIFAYFITNYFPSGLKGLMVAGTLAATMSTLDSTINALSASFYNDIIQKNQQNNVKDIKSRYKKDNLIITFLLMLVAFIATKSDGLLILGLKITSWTAGPLTALFFAKLIWQKWIKVSLSFYSVIGSYLLGIIGVYINTYVLGFSWYWNVYFGFVCATIFLKLLGIKENQKLS